MDIITPKIRKRTAYALLSLAIATASLQKAECQASTTLYEGISTFLESAFIPLSQLKEVCNFEINSNHQVVYCLDQIDIKNISRPAVTSACGHELTMSFQDEYIDLGCTASGLTRYFAPSQWEVARIKGDGGVDVTGAPNKILVEGANKAFISASPQSRQQYFIVIPAEGFVAFDWKQIGGSNLFTQAFSLLINNAPVLLQNQSGNGGSFFSGHLTAGDLLTLQIDNARNKELQFSIENFTFHTNAIAIYKRTWKVEDSAGNHDQFDQFITVERASLAEVIFPADRNGVQAPAVMTGNPADPSSTGFPVVDRDGNPSTTDDQYRIDDKDCAFEVTWIDNDLSNTDGTYISRLWMITDYCSGSNMEMTQVIKLVDGYQNIPAKLKAHKEGEKQEFNSVLKVVKQMEERPSGLELMDK